MFGSDLSGSAKDLPSNEMRGDLLRNLRKRSRSRHQIIFVATIAIALAIRVVFIDHDFRIIRQ